MSALQIRQVGYDHPDASRLTAEVQQVYVERYGGPDSAPIDPSQFRAPDGLFAVGYLDEQPVAMGGWRAHHPDDPQTSWASPAVEVKRMYVAGQARGQGFARQLLSFLERSAIEAGARWVLLETGSKQPEALALYLSCGYQQVPAFGYYAEMEQSKHLGKQVG